MDIEGDNSTITIDEAVVEHIQLGIEKNNDAIDIIKSLVQSFPFSKALQDFNVSIDATLPEANLKKVMQQLATKSIQKQLESEEEILWFMQLVEGFYGASYLLGMFSDFEQSWNQMAGVTYRLAKIEMEQAQYEQAMKLAETAIQKSTHWKDPYTKVPLMLLYGSLLTNAQMLDKARMIFNMVHVTLTPYMKDKIARDDHFAFIYQYHASYAAFLYLSGNYEQVIHLLEQLREWYGKHILDNEQKNMLAQCYEHLGDLEKRDAVMQNL